MSKTIWKIELWDKETRVTTQEIYFFFYRSAMRWLKENESVMQEQGLGYYMGGEPLWWRFKKEK